MDSKLKEKLEKLSDEYPDYYILGFHKDELAKNMFRRN